MTATSAGSSTCLTSKGLDISLAALRRQDPYINNIVDVASQVALYTFNNRTNEWEKTEVEGTLFVYTRLASPRHGFTITNRLSMENLTEPITKELDFQLQDPFLLYRNARLVIHGIWFYDKQDCQRIAQRMKTLTQQEQALAQSHGGVPLPPGGGLRAGDGGGGGVLGGGGVGGGGGGEVGRGVEGQPVDILQMLAKARNEYDKGGQSSSEPKEIGGSSMLFGNPHLIKPIPVKPNSQDGEPGEPRSLSLATLFGSQPAHPSPSNNAGPLSPRPPAGIAPSPAVNTSTGSGRKPGGRPAVARSLSYDDPAGAIKAARGPGMAGPNTVPLKPPGAVATSSLAPLGDNTNASTAVLGAPGSPYVVAGVGPRPPTGPLQPQHQQPNQQQQNPLQLCPAIQKLIQGPRCPSGPGAPTLHPVSESPENRQFENGLTLEQHHHHLHHQHHIQHQHLQQHHRHQQQHHLQQQQQQHHLQQQQQQQQQHHLQQQQQQQYQQSLQHDHIQRLFQAQAQAQAQAPVSAGPCCSNPPPPLIPSIQRPLQPITVDCGSYPHPQQNPHVFFSPGKPHPDVGGPSSQQASVGSPSMPGVAPHELLQKLQLVQQEQSQASQEAPRHGPGLAARFQGSVPTQDPSTAMGSADKETMRYPVISPQRIPATVVPTLLLSPSVFSQAKAVGPPQDNGPRPQAAPEEAGVLSRSQLQETLLHLIQTDSSFVDCIYKAYVSGLAKNPGSKF